MQLSILVDYLKVLIEKICQINYMKMFQTKQLKIFSIHSIYLFKEALIIKSFSRGLKNTHQIWNENKKLAKTLELYDIKQNDDVMKSRGYFFNPIPLDILRFRAKTMTHVMSGDAKLAPTRGE